MPSVTSTSCSDARSICEYDFTAPTSSDTRRVDSLTWPSRLATDSVLATHSSPASSAGPSRSSEARSHQAMSTPAAVSAGARTQSRPTSCRANHVDSSSSRSASASGSRNPVGGTISRRSASSAENCSAEISPRASRRSDASSVSSSVSSESTARVAAAAGLLISCASPAESVPSVMSASRCRVLASMCRAVLKSPSTRWRSERYAVEQLAQGGGGHAQDAPVGRRLARSPGRARAGPTRRSRRPTGRARRAGRPPFSRAGPGGPCRCARRAGPTRSRAG